MNKKTNKIKCVVLDFDDTMYMTGGFRQAMWSILVRHTQPHMLASISAPEDALLMRPQLDYGQVPPHERSWETTQPFSAVLLYDAFVRLAVQSGMLRVQGLVDFLHRCQEGNIRVCVSSALPKNTITELIQVSGLARYIDGVYGDPNKKAEHLHTIMDVYGLVGGEVLMVGDSLDDCHGAERAGTNFVLVDFGGDDVPSIGITPAYSYDELWYMISEEV